MAKSWSEIRKKSKLTAAQREEDDAWVQRELARRREPMKVAELIQKLQALDPKLEVLCYTEDEGLLAKGQLFRLLHIESVDVGEGEFARTPDGAPTLKFGKGPNSTNVVSLHVTGTF